MKNTFIDIGIPDPEEWHMFRREQSAPAHRQRKDASVASSVSSQDRDRVFAWKCRSARRKGVSAGRSCGRSSGTSRDLETRRRSVSRRNVSSKQKAVVSNVFPPFVSDVCDPSLLARRSSAKVTFDDGSARTQSWSRVTTCKKIFVDLDEEPQKCLSREESVPAQNVSAVARLHSHDTTRNCANIGEGDGVRAYLGKDHEKTVSLNPIRIPISNGFVLLDSECHGEKVEVVSDHTAQAADAVDIQSHNRKGRKGHQKRRPAHRRGRDGAKPCAVSTGPCIRETGHVPAEEQFMPHCLPDASAAIQRRAKGSGKSGVHLTDEHVLEYQQEFAAEASASENPGKAGMPNAEIQSVPIMCGDSMAHSHDVVLDLLHGVSIDVGDDDEF